MEFTHDQEETIVSTFAVESLAHVASALVGLAATDAERQYAAVAPKQADWLASNGVASITLESDASRLVQRALNLVGEVS